jgi:hypothetical protein
MDPTNDEIDVDVSAVVNDQREFTWYLEPSVQHGVTSDSRAEITYLFTGDVRHVDSNLVLPGISAPGASLRLAPRPWNGIAGRPRSAAWPEDARLVIFEWESAGSHEATAIVRKDPDRAGG